VCVRGQHRRGGYDLSRMRFAGTLVCRRARRTAVIALCASVSVLVSATAAGSAGSASVPPPSLRMQTAMFDPAAFGVADPAGTFDRVRRTGATAVRLVLAWRNVAPAAPPPEFDPSDPGDPGYDWSSFDQQIRAAADQGLEPIVNIFGAPEWATEREVRGGDFKPDPERLAAFGRAAARRYSGTYEGLPRVRYWELWNEPNLALFLRPQLIGQTVYSAGWYRKMLNAFTPAVHGIHADNAVIAGSTAPFTSRAGARTSWGPGPLLFMRELLCLSKELRPKCSERARFDIWAHHPYTSGGPSHRANISDDVSLGDLPRMRAVLDAGVATGRIQSQQKVRFWVTEFSWDTNPPDRNAMPIALQTRWVSEALYRMAEAGVSLSTWFLVRDEPLTTPYQSGLYFRDGRPKPSLQAFRFPFVAFRRDESVVVWGRTPAEKRGRVVVEQRSGGGWKQVGTLRSNSFGVFRGSFSAQSGGALRARLASAPDASRPFSLKEPPDRFYRPFGEQR
jgi:hypothetical protein